ncbi:MAG: ATP-binding sensor histidine kinase [Cyanobacteria bacterium J06639_1]
MGEIAGYTLLEKIYESSNSLVYRRQNIDSGTSAIVKILKEDYPTPSELTRYRQEYEITRSLDLDGVVRAYQIEPYKRTLAIALEDFGGRSLKDLYQHRATSLEDFFEIACQVVEILGRIHSRNIIHKDINPSNIILNVETNQIKIIDFGIATQLTRENPTLKNPRVLEGTLAYMAPEQTGRMNRALDYRTDFYSLGVTFYELLTGQLPFPSQDALELVHCHIAQQPVPPIQVNPEIPQGVSDLVMKLMAKTAEARYQNAAGLLADLDHCAREYRTTGAIAPFKLGGRDLSDRFHIPQKLYGRETEIAAVLAAFERVSQPQQTASSELMLVAGYSGIGKSSLVSEVHKPITEKRGYFIAGKYDQFQRDVPYSAVIGAFKDLVKQLLTEPETQLQVWRSRLLTALGPNGRVVTDVIPDVALIVGEQPPVPELGPSEAQNRFNLVFQNFMRVFCAPEHPLVLFLDDLQWADSASLKLLRLMVSDREMPSLLAIGAYRDNEVSPTHPLITLLDRLLAAGAIVHTITLAPLSLRHLTQLIGDTLPHSTEAIEPLAELVLQKTEGNPFFVNEFLKNLHAESLLTFNERSRLWEWDIARIQAQDLTDNVVELLISRLQKLRADTQAALRLAACIGAQFDLATLAIARQTPASDVFDALKPAIQTGLIIALSDLNEQLAIERFRFGHDRIQQAAYALIATKDRAHVHLRIGRLLRDNMSAEALAERIFEIVDHLNQAIHLVEDEAECQQLARLNLQAGLKATSATAYQAALRYLLTGLELLGDRGWQQVYELTLDLHQAAVEAAYLSQDFERQAQLTDVVLHQARSVLDRVNVYRMTILARSSQNRHLEATDIGFEILAQLGVQFPEPSPENLELELQKTRELESQRSIQSLIDLPEMSIPEKRAAMQILSDILSSGYQAAFDRFILSNLTQIQLSTAYGNTAASAFAYDCYGIILCGSVGDIESGYQFGQLAQQVVERYRAKQSQSRVMFVFNAFVRHWKDPLSHTIPDLQAGYLVGLETGDVEYAAYSLCWEAMHSLLTGRVLEPLAARMNEFNEAIATLQQAACLLYLQIYQQTVANLQGKASDLSRLDGEFLQEDWVVVDSADNKLALAFFYTHKAMLCYLLEDYETAIACTQLGTTYADGMTAAYTIAALNFYDSLTRLARYDRLPEAEQQQALAQVEANQQHLRHWASHAPENHLHKFVLVEAERDRCLGRAAEAGAGYDRAIALAKTHDYPNEEAIANELAARFYLQQERDTFAQVYSNDAYYGYYRWGATAKVQQLERRYPQLRAASLETEVTGTRVADATVRTTPSVTHTASTTQGNHSLDLAAVLQASQAIASEIAIDKLLATLTRILVRAAGAQIGHLLLDVNGQLAIEATCDAAQQTEVVLQSKPIADCVPQTLINFVSRTQEGVVLERACETGNFRQDPYIQANQSQSVLCAPLLNQGQLSGIVYLENNLLAGAFTPDRLEVLQLLSSQAAIAIDQARLYANLEQKVAERTQKLSDALDELKRTQDGLIQAEKMAALGQLVAGVAHEINTPVGNAMLAASVLENETRDFRDAIASGSLKKSLLTGYVDTARDSSQLILNNLNRAAELIQNFKQVAVDQASLEQRTFAVVPYIRSVLTSLEPQLKKTPHQVTVTGDAALEITSYPGALSQVVANFVTNSLAHAYPADRYPADRAGQLSFHVASEDDCVILTYEDDGCGIPAAIQSKIFEPFFTTARDRGGSGLGLHIVHNIVIQTLRGTLQVESAPESGTRFTLALPLHASSPPTDV